MKSLSAAIVVASGITAVIACGFIPHDGTQNFVGFCGFATLLFGMMGWISTLRSAETSS